MLIQQFLHIHQLSRMILGNLEIEIPVDLVIQKKKAKVIEYINNKIELNNRIITVLEAMAKPFMTTGSFSLIFLMLRVSPTVLPVGKWYGTSS